MKRPFKFLLGDDLRSAAQEAAAEREMDLATWIRQAMLAYLKTHKRNTPDYHKEARWPSGYPKAALCFGCGECSPHDPLGVHVESITQSDLNYAAKHPCKP